MRNLLYVGFNGLSGIDIRRFTGGYDICVKTQSVFRRGLKTDSAQRKYARFLFRMSQYCKMRKTNGFSAFAEKVQAMHSERKFDRDRYFLP